MSEMFDETEEIRKARIVEINAEPAPGRAECERVYGKCWDTDEVRKEFDVLGFMAPFVVVRRKADGKKGSLEFQHSPRFYFNWQEA